MFRYPGMAGAIVLGAMLVALVASGYPLFLARSQSKLLAAGLADPTIQRYGAGLFYGVTNVRFEETAPDEAGLLADRLDQEFRRIAARGPHLGEPIRFVLGAGALITDEQGHRPPSGPIAGRLAFGTDADAHVHILAGDPSDGALLPDQIARVLGIQAGDVIRLNGKIPLRVGGIYRALVYEPRSGYWSPWSEQIYPCYACPPPPQFILVRADEVMALTQALHDVEERDLDYAWMAPIEGPLTIDQARKVSSYAGEILRRVTSDGDLGQLFRCCRRTYRGPLISPRDTEFRSEMPLVLRGVDRHSASIEGPLRLLLIAGLTVTGAVVAATAAFALFGRRVEAAWLHAHGWGPVGFATKAAVEAAIPIIVGAAIGLGSAALTLSAFGPQADAGRPAYFAAGGAAVAAAAAALVVFAVASAASFVRAFGVRERHERLAWIPWEVLAIAASLWVLSQLRGGGALVADDRLDIVRPSGLLLAFPVLFIAGFAAAGARFAVAALRRAVAHAPGKSLAAYVSLRRLTYLPALTVLLVGAGALCLGVHADGQTLVRSLRATVDAKAHVFVGSDVSVLVDYNAPAQRSFPLPITRSTRLNGAGRMQPGDVPFAILGVDATTVADAAYWDPAFADDSLATLASRLPSDGAGPLPALLVQGSGDPTQIDTAQAEIPIRIVGRAIAFPGVSSDDPVIVVDTASLTRTVDVQGNPFLSTNARTEYWIKGPTDEALAAVGNLEAYPLAIVTAEQVRDVPFVNAAIETFAMLNLLGLAAGLLVLGALFVYLQSRQRARAIASVLSSRMGMSDRDALTATILEVGSILIAAFVLGGCLGVLAGFLVSGMLDPLQSIPPPPLFRPAGAVLAATLGAIVAISGVIGVFVHRRGSSVDLGEVLRVAD
jgi:putative ABC transport system permease protein